ncbi:hypothetical protein NADFUDRAFT_84331 [Nadsonia fulvescens var. elongata DSM 6958]|uniref:Thioredoxin-like fold domain-containing protein n=1 Tax=Nadsonia fulvescens var. elongata DSM 6958 TaxID=857566 RepID=A0A1E3PFS0_9ASCO|nr:hypothetical protein NADFUDRAFT_84331 [Nadsonia fulvescens var. elongata DSM 6958]
MSVSSRLASHTISFNLGPSKDTEGKPSGRFLPHVVDLYLDYNCPYSGKMFNKVYDGLFVNIRSNSVVESDSTPSSQVLFVFHQVPQPWHPTSTLMHEAALAVAQLTQSPEKFWKFSKALFDNQVQYFDSETYHETRPQTYERLAQLAASTVGVDKAAVLELITVAPAVEGKPHNNGNKVAVDFKYNVRYARQIGVHVTPTVAVDGIIDNTIESSFSSDQWIERLSKL